jgi:hypothetical protein
MVSYNKNLDNINFFCYNKTKKEWRRVFMDFYNAWHYLDQHEMFKGHFLQCLDIEVAKINSKTREVDDNDELNDEVEVWLEAGPWIKEGLAHDISLDCGASTFEDAIIELAKLVKKYYGDTKNSVNKRIIKIYGEDAIPEED